MLEHKLDCIRKAGVDCIVNACPFCHLQFDGGRLLSMKNSEQTIPFRSFIILSFSAARLFSDQLGIEQNAVQNIEFLAKIYEISAGLS